MSAAPPAEVLAQLEALDLDNARPLLISDADEVLLAFMAALERYLAAEELYFDWSSFALNGNIRRRADDGEVPWEAVKEHLERFFARHAHEMEPVPGAAAALAALAERAQIVVLSNVPLAQLAARRESLARHGMDYPLVANIGSKGPPVRHLAERVAAPLFFLDDIPRNHSSVARDAARVHRIHLIADRRLAELLGPAEDCHYRAPDWPAARAYIEARLDELGF